MTAHSCPLLPEVIDEEYTAYAVKKERRKGDNVI
jgi:hypothetical protein